MALTRKMLRAMGIDEEKIEQIIEAHTETMEALKTKADTYEEDAKKLEGVQKELDDLKKDGGDWQTKYEKEHSDFEAYKSTQTQKETKAAKEKAYRSLLSEMQVSEKRHDLILKATDLDGYKLGKDGGFENVEEIKASISKEYGDFIETMHNRGASAANPPANHGGSAKTKDEIMAIKDTATRQAEMLKNPGLFGIT